MYVIVVGAGKVGLNLARELIDKGNELTIVENIARCNNPRNLQHFELLGVKPAVSATDLILRLIEHEVPRYGLLHLLDLPQERLEIIEVEVAPGSPADGTQVRELGIPEG